jgi:hypothetical protein
MIHHSVRPCTPTVVQPAAPWCCQDIQPVSLPEHLTA